MSNYFLYIALLYLSAIIMPGPSVILITKNHIIKGSKSAFYSSLGIITGLMIQSGVILIFISKIDNNSKFIVYLNNIGALFLIYLGINNFFKKNNATKKNFTKEQNRSLNSGLLLVSYIEGFLLETLNPIALIFFFTIFSSIFDLNNQPSIFIKFLYWSEIALLGILWFCGLSLLLSSKFIKIIFNNKTKSYITYACSSIFIVYGIKMLSSSDFQQFQI